MQKITNLCPDQSVVKNGVSYAIKVVSPSESVTSLQVVCFVDFTKNQHYEGGTYAVNEHFQGAIDEVRKSGIFRGNEMQTLLLTPMLKQIPAQKLLLIGLGEPDKLSLDLFNRVGYCVVLEAVKLGVPDLCFAPSIKDAGLSGFAAADVSKALALGMNTALETASILFQKNLAPEILLKEIFLLAGQTQADNAYKGLKEALV
ncbi:hypothetical protein QFZ37_003403 [Chryseobacterium ginsenosidimutans]|uniref:M17 family peptidase N-terminal domain-containing protein n=1 Tax=Chryseobacterium ginsenosidimutans TaxID=687846 RepID=UPI002788C23F|nr:M17 family peptidase N-terminal domain-containing protein [Chryseobacterium ginsenosidimutans]MDQ0595034.1 hypothetical protein [Chryseobacterium ginsenosidimutans]